ncbi:MAG: protease [Verrucomicrobia bacterium]|nr:protease [Verrucomicrobiota bacterium]
MAIIALWLSGDEASVIPAWRRFAWLYLAAAAVVAALAFGIVRPLGVGWIFLFGGATWAFSRPTLSGWHRAVAAVAILGLGAGLMVHLLPGFQNPRVLAAVAFTPDAIPYTLYLNLDKTLAGILLLGWCHRRSARAADWRATLVGAAPWAAGLLVAIMGLSLAAGYVRFAPKFPRESWLWMWVNLCFTCLAEEALFRGFIQAQLQRAWKTMQGGNWLALGVAAFAFGLAHGAGGLTYVVLATVAGVGYGWVYQRTGRIEASILTHFSLNTVHFFLFTYPALKA